ncbi:prolyl oligopeptidase family serine peptidase [Reichenbachiella sp.]|uniref:alpha/beta hydrolase family protein n=1 Tax=Reichenbachiella sp. TaxID=2184521 RepID=UPI003297DCD9
MKGFKRLGIAMAMAIVSCDSTDSTLISGEGVFTTDAGNAIIEGELFLPAGDGPFPVLIVVPGSGDETREAAEPFAPIFNAYGYGLFIYDKRGLGGSTGSYPLETLENPFDFLSTRVDDVISIVNLLKTHIAVDMDHIGLFGSSQGTWVNTMVYSQIGNDIGMMIMASGGAASTRVEQYYEVLIGDEVSLADANQKLFDYDGDLGYDPKPVLEKMEEPVLFIFGGKDDSHPTLYDKQVVETMQKTNFTIHFYENADHSLIDVETGSIPDDLFAEVDGWLKTIH